MLKKILKNLLNGISILVALVSFYLLAAYTLPFITVNKDYKDSDAGIKMFVLSNGVHTDIVVPAKTQYKDWTISFPKDAFDVKDSLSNFIAFGWGDKGFYLNTPEWSDLKASTAIKGISGLGGTAMHVRYSKERKKESDRCKIFSLSKEQYGKLILFIEKSFEKKEGNFIKIEHPGYGQFDRFYEAKGSYTLFKTCNSWTNNGLKEIGVKVARWSPFAKGLMNSLKH